MTTHILLVTHPNLGDSLLKTLSAILGGPPTIPITCYEVRSDAKIDSVKQAIHDWVTQENQSHHILALTDLFGATPHNLVTHIRQMSQIPAARFKIVSGLNLPMLLKLMNYPNESLDTLAEKARTGGTHGICIQ